jgi:hypothetical protein
MFSSGRPSALMPKSSSAIPPTIISTAPMIRASAA